MEYPEPGFLAWAPFFFVQKGSTGVRQKQENRTGHMNEILFQLKQRTYKLQYSR